MQEGINEMLSPPPPANASLATTIIPTFLLSSDSRGCWRDAVLYRQLSPQRPWRGGRRDAREGDTRAAETEQPSLLIAGMCLVGEEGWHRVVGGVKGVAGSRTITARWQPGSNIDPITSRDRHTAASPVTRITMSIATSFRRHSAIVGPDCLPSCVLPILILNDTIRLRLRNPLPAVFVTIVPFQFFQPCFLILPPTSVDHLPLSHTHCSHFTTSTSRQPLSSCDHSTLISQFSSPLHDPTPPAVTIL